MQSIKEIITNPLKSPYRGSEKTYENVKSQLQEKYGSKCAKEFNPHVDVMPYSSWLNFGFKVKRGEKALKSITYLKVKDDKGVERTVMRTVNLFHKRQVEEVK